MLKTNDDLILIEDVKKNNNSDSLKLLAQKHAGIFLQIAKCYTGGTETIKFPIEEVLEQKEAIVYEAIKDFDPQKGFKFPTWLGSKLKYYCLNEFKNKSKYLAVEPTYINFIIDNPEHHSYTSYRNRDELEIKYIKSILNQVHDRRIKKIINWRYFSENKKHTKFAYIAKKLNMSIQGVINLHNKFIDLMRQKITTTENMDKI